MLGRIEDAQSLSFGNETFDFVLVADGLHHCGSPNMALLEICRVARSGTGGIESRDSLIMRLANRLALSPEYEFEAVFDYDGLAGGLNDSAIPNLIYRWTEQQFCKVIQSIDLRGRHTFRYFYGLNLPRKTVEFWKNPALSIAISLVAPLRSFINVEGTQAVKFHCDGRAQSEAPRGSMALAPVLGRRYDIEC